MGRGSSQTVPANDILYGHTPPRDLRPKQLLTDTGAVEFYSADQKLYKVEVPEGAEYIIKSNGEKKTLNDPCTIYFQGGKVHRDGGPAIVTTAGVEMWYQHGSLHRDNDEPSVINPNGFRGWHKYGQRHRETGPAMAWKTGEALWWLKDQKYETEEEWRSALDKEYTLLEL